MANFSSPDGELTSVFATVAQVDALIGNELWLWGNGTAYRLGDNTVTKKSYPVQTVSGGTDWNLVSCGRYHAGAIKTDGTLWMWGFDTHGQLGDNSVTAKGSPNQTIAGGTNWKLVSCAGYYTAAIKTDGTLWTWGINDYGQLGDNTVTKKSSPVQTVAGGTNWKQVACGYYHAAAIKTDGTLWTWGRNDDGELGDNTVTKKSSPVQTVAGGTNWKQIAGTTSATAAIKTDGTLWLWGINVLGGLGDNTRTSRSSPVQTVAAGTNWKQVALADGYFSAAVKTNGTLWTWGSNTNGQLGDNTRTGRSSPVQTVAGGTNWKFVSCANYHIGAIKTDGTLWMWGRNNDGELGDNTTTSVSSPIQTVAGGTNWKQIACGYQFTGSVSYPE